MTFDPQTALAYARALARPRLLGTGGDETVARALVHQLQHIGWQVERQPFAFVTGVNQAVRWMTLSGEILILLIFWAWGVSNALALLPAALLLGLLASAEPLLRAAEHASLEPTHFLWSKFCWRFGTRYQAANIVANPHPQPLPRRQRAPTGEGRSPSPIDALPKGEGRGGGGLPHLYLLAHLDSKGQFIPILVRVFLFAALGGGALALALATFGRAWFPALTSLGALAGIGALLAGVPLLFLDTDNRSPGAIDNASGLGLVLHLAECLNQTAAWRDRLNITVLLTSAEELALMGAAAYVHRHLTALKAQAQNGLFILNVDGVGVRGGLRYVGQPGPLLHHAQAACADLGLPLARLGLIGVLFDHLPFARHGFNALTLTAVGRASWWVHTAHDTADKLDVSGFQQAGAVVLKVIERLTREE